MDQRRKPMSQISLDGHVIPRKRQRLEEESPSTTKEPRRTQPGTVSHMLLKNFMCHSHLEVTFDNNINYVVGRNGSGKSAILTALVIGLGGKASLTNRGNSIKSFIKAGKQSATVEITLRNHGSFGYRTDVYGDEITVIRHFLLSGTSSYKIKSAAGAVVTTLGKEVQRICTDLNIQIDNPVCVLNQDTSRNFLNTKDLSQKYSLFMRATQLDVLYDEYKKVAHNKKEAERIFREKETLYTELKQELKELRKRVESQKKIIELKEHVVALQTELLWSKVVDAEEETNTKEQALKSLQEEQARIEAEMNADNLKQSTSTETIANLARQVGELRESVEDQNRPQAILVEQLGELKEEANEKLREKRMLTKDIALKSGNCVLLEQEVTKLNKSMDQIEQQRQNRLNELAKIRQNIASMAALLQTSNNDGFQVRNIIEQLDEQHRTLREELQHVQSKIGNANRQLNSLQNESDTLSVYGADMSRIVAEIKANGSKFVHPPRGPLGSYISLKDKKWAIAVEAHIGKFVLSAFVVDNREDSALLNRILDKICRGHRPMIITTKFFFRDEDIDVSRNLVRPTHGCHSMYSMLEFSDPVVRNCIIDQTNIENILLIPDMDTAIQVMSDQHNVPRNCTKGVTVNGAFFYPDPNYKYYASRYHRAQYLQASKADFINNLQQTLAKDEATKKTIENQINSVRADIQEQERKKKELAPKIDKLTKAVLHLKQKRDDLQDVVEPDQASVEAMAAELEVLKRIVEDKKVTLAKLEEEWKEIHRKVNRKEEKLEALTKIVQGYEDRIRPLQRQIEEMTSASKSYHVNKRFAQRRLDETLNKVRIAQSDALKSKQVTEQSAGEAAIIGERPAHVRKIPQIMSEMTRQERVIRQIESEMESPEELFQKFTHCKSKHAKATELMVSLRENVKELQVASKKRRQYYKRTEDYFITCIKHAFEIILRIRQFKGYIDINTDERKLDLIVVPQQGAQGLTNTSNLSGGERSFSTVAFLYSLWQCVHFPFYFLDEFDVFMDKVNRDIALSVLKDYAKKNPDLQFVFLTPQDISSVINDKSVSIHRLEDPERSKIT